jgi:regulator of sigma E protease
MELVVRAAAIAVAFGLTVFVHEAGHFAAARLSGMTVYEFSIGIGRPLLFWFKRGGTQYSFRLWPIFHYVRIAGMEPGDDHPQGFHKKSRLVQAFVLVMGCLMNFLLAVVIFVFIGSVMGRTVEITNTVARVLSGTPAAQAGFAVGDRLVGVEGQVDMPLDEVQKFIRAHPEERITVEVERGAERLSLAVTPERMMVRDVEDDQLVRRAVGRIGVSFRPRTERLSIGRSIAAGFHDTGQMILMLGEYFFDVVRREKELELIGPVGVVQFMYDEAKASWQSFLFTFAAVTVTIGFINLVPIPPLDGSRLVIVTLEAIRRRPFDKRKEVVVHLIGFALLIGLFVVLTYKDILRIVSKGAW